MTTGNLPAADGRFAHEEIRASAGTGKTYQLTSRFLSLLEAGAPLDQVLATTFTRKAAGEILDRVMEGLAKAASRPSERNKLAERLGLVRLDEDRCRAMLQTVVQQVHRLRISTLDAFFSQVARAFGLELGLPPGWQIASEDEEGALQVEAMDGLLQDRPEELVQLVHLLAKGETTRSVGDLIWDTVANLYEVYLHASRESWDAFACPAPLRSEELELALEALSGVARPANKSFCKGLDEDLQRARSGDWELFVEKGIPNALLEGNETYCRVAIDKALQAAYAPLMREAKARILRGLERQNAGSRELLESFDGRLRQLKDRHASLGFLDVTRTLAGQMNEAAAAEMEYRLDARLSHLLLDEFQDTSLDQWRVLRPFARRIAARPGEAKHSLFCVGDVKQAIYGWRGGVAELFESLQADLGGVLSQRPLNKSFRSAPPVIETVNRIFQRLGHEGEWDDLKGDLAAWQKRFETHTTDKTTLPGYVTLETCPAAGEEEDDETARLAYAAERVAAIAREAPGREIAVIVRQNVTVGKMIFQLQKLGLEASDEKGSPLTDSAAVQLVLSLLRLVDHPGDEVARFHLCHSPLAKAAAIVDQRDTAGALRLGNRLRRELQEEGYGKVVSEWAARLDGACNEREARRLAQLVSLAYDYQSLATLRTDDFARFVSVEKVADPSAHPICVLNMHQSKGLEYDIVVLPELEVLVTGRPPTFVLARESPMAPVEGICRHVKETVQRLLPPSLRRAFKENTRQRVTETLCLLYVAVTRARCALHMLLAPSRSNERKPPKTMAGLLRSALTDGKPLGPRHTAYVCGDPRWHEKAEPEKRKPMAGAAGSKAAAGGIAVREVRLAPAAPGAGAGRGKEQVAPSRLEGGGKASLTDLWQPERRRALDYGTLIHLWLAEIRWLEEGMPQEEAMLQLAAAAGFSAARAREVWQSLVQMLGREEVRRGLLRSSYEGAAVQKDRWLATLARPGVRLEVRTELAIAAEDEGQMMSGSIDRVVLLTAGEKPLGADIIDFKTDGVAVGDAAGLRAKVEHYGPQLAAYRKAARAMWRLPDEAVRTRLLFVNAGIVCETVDKADVRGRTEAKK